MHKNITIEVKRFKGSWKIIEKYADDKVILNSINVKVVVRNLLNERKEIWYMKG